MMDYDKIEINKLVRQNEALKKRCKALAALLACYRLHKCPAEEISRDLKDTEWVE